jgi:hypothetical protein
VHAQQTLNFSSVAESQYIPRGRNELHRIFEQHFSDFCSEYDMKYATDYGKFRLQRIESVGEKFITCGDYLHGIARIRCQNKECGYDYFRPFSCKGFYLCPSCSQKRTLLLSEHFTEELFLETPPPPICFYRAKSPSAYLSPQPHTLCQSFTVNKPAHFRFLFIRNRKDYSFWNDRSTSDFR